MNKLNDLKYYQNYHKHTSYSHRYNKDSPLIPMDYLKYMKENADKGIPQIYSTVEHGWQSPYFAIYNDLEKFNKDNSENNKDYKPIKFVFGTEGYWVKDRKSQDSSNCHICLLAMTDNARKKINRAIYESFNSGYYYKNRMDLDILLSLPKDEVFVTSACIAFWKSYTNWDTQDFSDIDKIVLQLNNYFTNFYLEVQANLTDTQKIINKHILDLHYKYNIPIIAGTDSHVIYESQMADRDDLLKSNSINYPDEQGWFMDYPSLETFIKRFQTQGILNDDEVYEAINNTNKTLDFEDIKLNRDLKVPILKTLRGKTQQERNQHLKDILTKEWNLQKSDINVAKHDEYIKAINYEYNEIEKCNMADYFIDTYEIMKLGISKYGGVLTPSGRGSAVSDYINKLLRLTKVDRINAPVTMYPERFLTANKIIESKTLPDIDSNCSDREPFIKAQKDLIGEQGTFDLIAFGKLHYKSAFKMYARAYNLDPQLANQVTKQINQYELAIKHTDNDDEKDLIDIYDYVDKEKYGNLIEGCQQYMGIIDNFKPHPCSTICADFDVIEEIGVIMVKSESQKNTKGTFVAVIESGTIDSFGLLKQDYLKVSSIGLIYDIYKEVGIKPFTVNELLKKIDNNDKVWNIYSDGYTMCVNQCEQTKATQKVMTYKPQNISELTQFIAAIRPSFQSMYKIFESRQHFDYGIKAFDNLIQDKYMGSSFILYQEILMKILSFAGFPMSETYTIIKAISKKKHYVINNAKEKFIPNFAQAILNTKETDNKDTAIQMSNKVWKVIEDSASYGFNCVSGDTKLYRMGTNNNNNSYIPTVAEMYNIMNDSKYAKKTKHKSLRGKYLKTGYGMCLSLKDNKLYKNKIIDIYKQPKAKVYLITTESGKTIKCTMNHKFPTINGTKTLSELKVGDSLYCLGNYEHKYFDSSFTNGDFESNVPKQGEQGFQNKPNGASVLYDDFRRNKIMNKCPCEKCGRKYTTDYRFEVHHKDFNRKHNETSNYIWLCASCHKKIHYNNGRTTCYGNGLPSYLEKIISINECGFEDVYDISMSEDVSHTFVTNNGIVTSNCSHAFCMAIDSVTLAYLKAYYPLEFYKVTLQKYTDDGDKDKVSLLKKEMITRGFKLNPIKFGDDNRYFTIDKQNNCINQTMGSIKNMQKIVPQIMYDNRNKTFNSIYDLFDFITNSNINKTSIDILIKLNYFSNYGNINQLLFGLSVYEKYATSKVLTKFKLTPLELKGLQGCYKKETDKQIRDIDNIKFISNIISLTPISPSTPLDSIHYELELLGYTDITIPDSPYYAVESVEVNQYGTPFITLYQISNGISFQYKCDKKFFNSYKCEQGDILDVVIRQKPKKKLVGQDKNGKNIWENGELQDIIKVYDVIKRNKIQ